MSPKAKLPIRMVLAMLAIGVGQAAAESPSDLVTASRAILCLSPASLIEAVHPAIANDQRRLRSLRCMRTEFGIPVTVMEFDSALDPRVPWQVRVHPQGIRGVTMWGYLSSFALPDGTAIATQIRRDGHDPAPPTRVR